MYKKRLDGIQKGGQLNVYEEFDWNSGRVSIELIRRDCMDKKRLNGIQKGGQLNVYEEFEWNSGRVSIELIRIDCMEFIKGFN